MNKLSKLISAVVVSAMAVSVSFAQGKVDQGYSVHNYKHPNKAKKASFKYTSEVYNLNTVERVSLAKTSGHVTNTPKYAPRNYTLAAGKPVLNETIDVNPLVSQYNYKTHNKVEKAPKKIASLETDITNDQIID